MFSAVVSPTPPGHGPGSVLAFTVANSEVFPAGLICTIVVPVPCPLSFAPSLALKLLISSWPAWSLPTLVGTVTIPYGLISPLAGTVEATLLTVLRFARKGAELALEVAVLAAADVLDELLVLLELPQPARTSATPARARIDVLGTGVSPVVRGIGRDGFPDRSPAPTGISRSLRRLYGSDQRTARLPRASCMTPPSRDSFPARFPGPDT